MNLQAYELMKFLNILFGAIQIPVGMYCAFCLGIWTEGRKPKWLRLFLVTLIIGIVLYIADSYIWYITMEYLT
jgi:hypothetical protein